MAVPSFIAAMVGNQDDGRKKKSVSEIRLFLSHVLERLEGVEPVVPVPGHFYRNLGGDLYYCTPFQDKADDHLHVVRVRDGMHSTVRPSGELWYTNLGTLINDYPVGDWPILVQDLGPVLGPDLNDALAEEVARAARIREQQAPPKCQDDE